MGALFTTLLLGLLAAAVFFAVRHSLRHRGCGGDCAGCKGCRR